MTDIGIATGTRLFYEVVPGTLPVGAPATLAIVVSNQGQRPQTCNRIAFGPWRGLAGSIEARPAGGTAWDIEPDEDEPGSFVAVYGPLPGDNILSAGQKLAFIFTGVEAESADTTGQIDVTESLVDADGAPTLGHGTLPVFPVRSGSAAITRFTAEPVAVTPQSKVTLTWETSGGDFKLSASDGSAYAVPARGTRDFWPTETTQYTLTAVPGGAPQAQLTVAVPEAYIVSFKATPMDVGVGAPTKLSWVAQHAIAALVDGDTVDDVGRGSKVVRHRVPGPARHELYVSSVPFSTSDSDSDDGGTTDSKTVPVRVHPIEATLRAADPVVPVGETTKLSWNVAWAAAQSIDQGIGPVAPAGSIDVMPRGAATTYTLTASAPPDIGEYPPQQARVTVRTAPALTQLRLNLGIDPATAVWEAIGEAATWGPSNGAGRFGVPLSGSAAFARMGPQMTVHELRVAHAGRVLRVLVDLTNGVPWQLAQFAAAMHGFRLQAVGLHADAGLTTPGAAAAAQWSAAAPVLAELPGGKVGPGETQHPFTVPDSQYAVRVAIVAPPVFGAAGVCTVTTVPPAPGDA